jgi:hypothetical protein
MPGHSVSELVALAMSAKAARFDLEGDAFRIRFGRIVSKICLGAQIGSFEQVPC